MAQWDLAVVDFGCYGLIAHIAVNGVGKIHHRGAARQADDFALGRHDINIIREEVDAHMLPKLRRVFGTLLNIHQRLQPFGGDALVVVTHFGMGFVEPVRGNTAIGDFVHGKTAQLHFNIHASRTTNNGM